MGLGRRAGSAAARRPTSRSRPRRSQIARGSSHGGRIQPLPAAPTWFPERTAEALARDPGLVDRLADPGWRDRVRRHLDGAPDPMAAAAVMLMIESHRTNAAEST